MSRTCVDSFPIGSFPFVKQIGQAQACDLADLGEVTEAEITAADRRVTDLAALVEPVDEAVISMRDLRERWPSSCTNGFVAASSWTA